MTTKKLISILLVLCMAVALLPMAVFADPEPESEPESEPVDLIEYFMMDNDGNYLISSSEDWGTLADLVKDEIDCAGCSFKLTDDITITKSVGEQVGTSEDSRMRFAGTFDGDGHTLTIDLHSNSEQHSYNKNYCAPFAYTKAVTIKNLTVVGTITSSGKFVGGLVGGMGEKNSETYASTIENVHVSVTITSSVNGDATIGGVVGLLETNKEVSITNCWFDGSFLGSRAYSCAGFVGFNKGTVNYTNVLFNPSEITFNTSHPQDISETFTRKGNEGSPVSNYIANCYYTKKLGSPNEAAKRVYAQKFDEQYNLFDEVVAVDGNTYYIHTYNMQWADVQDQLADQDVDTCTVLNDLLAGENNTAIVCGREFTIDLNDCTLDRALADAEGTADGWVIKVEAGGVLTLKNGKITGGHVTGNGGGIYVASGAVLNLENVTVTGNKANNKGAVYVENGGTINVKGNVHISENYYGVGTKTEKNLYLAGAVITFNGALSQNSLIGLAMTGNVGVFTDGMDGNAAADNFKSDLSSCVVRVDNATGEAKLCVLHNVTVAGGIANGRVSASMSKAAEGDEITLTVTPANGYVLKTLTVKEGENDVAVEDNSFTMPNANVTVSAEFELAAVTVGVYENAILDVIDDKNTVTIIGTVDGLNENNLADYDHVTIQIDFYQNGNVIKSVSDDVTSLKTTVRGVASTNESTAAAQGTEYVDAGYIFAVRMKGIPAGEYSAVVTVSLVDNNEGTVSTATETIDFTVD